MQARTAESDRRVKRDQRGDQELPDDSTAHHVTLGPTEGRTSDSTQGCERKATSECFAVEHDAASTPTIGVPLDSFKFQKCGKFQRNRLVAIVGLVDKAQPTV
jgi:hypothetical protein